MLLRCTQNGGSVAQRQFCRSAPKLCCEQLTAMLFTFNICCAACVVVAATIWLVISLVYRTALRSSVVFTTELSVVLVQLVQYPDDDDSPLDDLDCCCARFLSSPSPLPLPRRRRRCCVLKRANITRVNKLTTNRSCTVYILSLGRFSQFVSLISCVLFDRL